MQIELHLCVEKEEQLGSVCRMCLKNGLQRWIINRITEILWEMSWVRTPQCHKKCKTDTSQKKLDGEQLLKKTERRDASLVGHGFQSSLKVAGIFEDYGSVSHC